jgi:hypothetical protein
MSLTASLAKLSVSNGFRLVGIDAVDLLNKFRKGIKTIKIPTDPIKRDVTWINNIMAPSYDTKNESSMYTFQDSNGTTVVAATTDSKAYTFANTNGGKLPEGGNCAWCRRNFKQSIMMCPIKFSKHSDVASTTKEHEVYLFHGITIQCGYRCALAYIRANNRDPKFKDSEQLLRFMFSLAHPGKELNPAPNYLLLELNGGALSDADFDNPKYVYIETPNLVLLPAKVVYHRLLAATQPESKP